MADKNLTTIAIEKNTHNKLMEIGSKGETFDEIINELLEKNCED